MRLSTEAPAEPATPTPPPAAATTVVVVPAGPRRVNRGYALREDLIKALKRIALEEDRPLYTVMEEAIEAYLARYHAGDA